ncbi:MAG: ABC transporter substrate-binding protein [Clostridioides sp.]|jgi:iron complex transport system substrate-binding protein|nr:ABC transporter substrate-binding protein [Clostridioides sp.]
MMRKEKNVLNVRSTEIFNDATKKKASKKMKFFACQLAIVMMLTFVLSGCSKTQESESNNTQTESSINLPSKDMAGNEIKLPEKIDKVISLTPSTTQVIDSLGLKDKLVAVDNQSPLYVEGLKDVTQFDMMNLDTEKLLSLQSQVMFVSDIAVFNQNDIMSKLKESGVVVVQIPTEKTIKEIENDIAFVASCFGEKAKGDEIVSNMQKDIEEIKKIGDTIKDKKTVLFEIASLPNIYSFGKDVFLNEMIDIIGAENVLGDQTGWLPVEEEAAVKSNPDVILTNVTYNADAVKEILERKGWENVTAVKNKAVYFIDNGASSLPNQNIVKALKEMAKAVYPDEYKDIK